MAFVSHHRSIASVHSSARSYWARPCNAHTSSQYTTPVESGSRSPETVATPASSSSASPCWTSPSRMSSRASATRPMAHAAGSHAEPTSMARRAHCRAPGGRRSASARRLRTTANHACAGVSARPSSSRSARANQPRTGAMSAVSKSRCIADPNGGACGCDLVTRRAGARRGRAPRPRSSRRDGRRRRRPRPARGDRGPSSAPSASASMRRSNAFGQSPRGRQRHVLAPRCRDHRHRPSHASRPLADRGPGRPAANVTVRVTAVTVLLTHLGRGHVIPEPTRQSEEDPWRTQRSTASS